MVRVMYGWRWWLFWGAAGVIAMTSAGWAADPPSKLGFVDIQAVISQSKEGQAAMNTVKIEAAEKQKEISAKEAEIKQMDTDLQKQASVLSEAAKKEREEEIRRKLRDLKRITEDFNRDLAKREGEMVNDLLRDLTVIIRDYGKEKGYTLIIEKGQSGVIYGNDAADLTKEVLDRYNTRRPKK
jgi:outer membrane protein